MRGFPRSVRRPWSVASTSPSHTQKAKRYQRECEYDLRESEAGGAGGGGTHFRCVDAEAEAREVRLAEGHAAGVQVAPDKEQQERDGGVVLVGDGVDDCEREIQAEQHLRIGHPAGFVSVRFFRERALLPFDIEFGRAGKFSFFFWARVALRFLGAGVKW